MFQSLTECKQLKLVAADGKRYLTDVMSTEQVLRLIQSVPSPKAEPMKIWLAHVGKQRTTAQLRGDLNLEKKANLRDNFGKYALIYTRLAEELATEKLGEADVVPMSVAMEIVWEVAKMIGRQASEVSQSLGYDLVTERPLLSIQKGKKK